MDSRAGDLARYLAGRERVDGRPSCQVCVHVEDRLDELTDLLEELLDRFDGER